MRRRVSVPSPGPGIAPVATAIHSRVIRSPTRDRTSGQRRYSVIRETPARRATSVMVVRRTPTAITQSRTASSTVSLSEEVGLLAWL
ncbi:hypothetical protein STENM327S_06549 [Streptomyces tendae]